MGDRSTTGDLAWGEPGAGSGGGAASTPVSARHAVPPLRLRLDSSALASNWRSLRKLSGEAACGAAVKADAYGLGALEVARRLAGLGCRDFFVASWAEAEKLAGTVPPSAISVLHGVGEDDLGAALALPARPVLNSAKQVRRWREAGAGRPCDVMLDSGINRIGLSIDGALGGLLDGIEIDTLMSHLACADEDVPLNRKQRDMLAAAAGALGPRRVSLANSAGICLGRDFTFDLTRPGIAIYGGAPRPEVREWVRQVVHIEARVLQRRRLEAGDRVGYNGTFTAQRTTELALINIGYADGYRRAFSNAGRAWVGGVAAPVVGTVSMDVTAICVDAAPAVDEDDWVGLDFDLPAAAAQCGVSQYELLTGLGNRYARAWS